MAVFQKREYHKDATEKHILNVADAAFLQTLQKELNTQPSMGQAHPAYWCIAQTREAIGDQNNYDAIIAVDGDGGTIAQDLEELASFLDNREIPEVTSCAYFNNSCSIHFSDGTVEAAYSIESAVELLQLHEINRIEIRYIRKEQEIVKDCLFLTHKSCEEHLRAYGYNYASDAHAFAMTAFRSPEYEQLIRLIRSVDWSQLHISGT